MIHPNSICLRRLALGFALLGYAGPVLAAEPDSWMLQLELGGVRVEGMPLQWSEQRVFLLARDGRLWDFHPDKAQRFQKTASYFRGYSPGQLRDALDRELGGKLEITATSHYLVAHPPGQGEQWAGRFEELYRAFWHYFSVRGFSLQEPSFPLVAIVWPSESEFRRYAQAEGVSLGRGVLGYYSLTTNRVALFDLGNATTAGWGENEATLVHEAAHQTAFNVGLHSRFAAPPRWLAEGLGMLFEAPGVSDSRRFPDLDDRVNRGRLRSYLLADVNRAGNRLVSLISSDEPFDRDPAAAYAQAWALTFFLVETEPRKYAQFLAKTRDLPRFRPYPSERRLADFTAIFGDDFAMLDVNLLRFLARLK